jgi:hypothetical protein
VTICHDFEKMEYCTRSIGTVIYGKAKDKRLQVAGFPDIAKAIQDWGCDTPTQCACPILGLRMHFSSRVCFPKRRFGFSFGDLDPKCRRQVARWNPNPQIGVRLASWGGTF